MKVIATIAAASMVLGAANADHTSRQLILGGGSFRAARRHTPPASVLPPTATPTAVEPKFVSVGTHYLNGTQDGEQIKVVSAQNHTSLNFSSSTYDFALLTLEKPSKFTPVKLPNADDSDIKPGMWSKAMGWGVTSYPNGSLSYELQGISLEVWANDECSRVYNIDDTSVCAGGLPGKDACVADTGGPLIKEKGQGDLDDILVGLVNWGYGCGDAGSPTVYSRVSTAIEWINSVTSGATRTKGQ
ncbi:Peptidase S1, PA clan [Phytophthora cactorum]|nr:Peptidase S1, PA clan [Phytophthora cactorum]